MAFRAKFIKNIIHFAGQRGAKVADLLAICGVEKPEDLNDEQLYFQKDRYDRIMWKALEQCGDPLFGLHLGEYLSLSAAGLIVQIAQSSRTVLEALEYTVAFANLGCQELPFQLQELDHAWELSLNPSQEWQDHYPQSAEQTVDGMMVFTLREFQSITLRKYQPLSVHFAYAKPGAQAEYQRIFQCPLRFSMPRTAFYLRKEQVTDAVVSSDYQLLRMLVNYAEQKLNAMEEEKGFANTIRQAIIHLAQPQFPTIQQTAANLNLSVRTLQRRLKVEGFTYQDLTDELKRQFAVDYLQNRRLSVKEIALSLDFAEASSFIRTFNRWYGTSPQLYREQHFIS